MREWVYWNSLSEYRLIEKNLGSIKKYIKILVLLFFWCWWNIFKLNRRSNLFLYISHLSGFWMKMLHFFLSPTTPQVRITSLRRHITHLAEFKPSLSLYGVQKFVSEHILRVILGYLEEVHTRGRRGQALGPASWLNAERRLQVLGERFLLNIFCSW